MEAQEMFQNILSAEYHGTIHDTPWQGDSFFFSLTFKKSLSEEDMTASIYVFTQIGIANSCTNVHLPVRQKPNLTTLHTFLNVISV
jgi:hypothetical protein